MFRYEVRRVSVAVNNLLVRQGEVHARFAAEGVELRSGLGKSQLNWCAFDSIVFTKHMISLRAGAACYPVPRDAVPADIDFDSFQTDIQNWHRGAVCNNHWA